MQGLGALKMEAARSYFPRSCNTILLIKAEAPLSSKMEYRCIGETYFLNFFMESQVSGTCSISPHCLPANLWTNSVVFWKCMNIMLLEATP
jgi:hypothetical protein